MKNLLAYKTIHPIVVQDFTSILDLVFPAVKARFLHRGFIDSSFQTRRRNDRTRVILDGDFVMSPCGGEIVRSYHMESHVFNWRSTNWYCDKAAVAPWKGGTNFLTCSSLHIRRKQAWQKCSDMYGSHTIWVSLISSDHVPTASAVQTSFRSWPAHDVADFSDQGLSSILSDCFIPIHDPLAFFPFADHILACFFLSDKGCYLGAKSVDASQSSSKPFSRVWEVSFLFRDCA